MVSCCQVQNSQVLDHHLCQIRLEVQKLEVALEAIENLFWKVALEEKVSMVTEDCFCNCRYIMRFSFIKDFNDFQQCLSEGNSACGSEDEEETTNKGTQRIHINSCSGILRSVH